MMENSAPPNFGGLVGEVPSSDQNFLDHYFTSVYNKLEADALLFNRKLPHAGLVGSENENAIGALLRSTLPSQYGIEINAIVIDRTGKASKQADIVIYDATRPTYFRKVFPVELVYAVIEVKTSMGSTEAAQALDNLASVSALNFRPHLTPYWQTKTKERSIHHGLPALYVFAFRTNCEAFETFARWFPWEAVHRGIALSDQAPVYSEVRTISIAALDQGIINMESTNGYVRRWIAESSHKDALRTFTTSLMGKKLFVDPAKALFLFIEGLTSRLESHTLHPGFDIRSYMSGVLGTVIPVDDSHLANSQS